MLHSLGEIHNFTIQATDGAIGHLDDFIIDDEKWEVRYIVVDTRKWWQGKNVLVAPQWIEKIDWNEEKILVNLTRESIQNSPQLESISQIDRDYESKLYDHYKRRKYWT